MRPPLLAPSALSLSGAEACFHTAAGMPGNAANDMSPVLQAMADRFEHGFHLTFEGTGGLRSGMSGMGSGPISSSLGIYTYHHYCQAKNYHEEFFHLIPERLLVIFFMRKTPRKHQGSNHFRGKSGALGTCQRKPDPSTLQSIYLATSKTVAPNPL